MIALAKNMLGIAKELKVKIGGEFRVKRGG